MLEDVNYRLYEIKCEHKSMAVRLILTFLTSETIFHRMNRVYHQGQGNDFYNSAHFPGIRDVEAAQRTGKYLSQNHEMGV